MEKISTGKFMKFIARICSGMLITHYKSLELKYYHYYCFFKMREKFST